MSMNIASRMTGQRLTTPTNIQRNGNVEATLEEKVLELEQPLIQAAKELYKLRRLVFSLQGIKYPSDSEQLSLENFTLSLGEAWARFHALETELKQKGHQLSLNALEIIEHANKNVNLNSPPAGIMVG